MKDVDIIIYIYHGIDTVRPLHDYIYIYILLDYYMIIYILLDYYMIIYIYIYC